MGVHPSRKSKAPGKHFCLGPHFSPRSVFPVDPRPPQLAEKGRISTSPVVDRIGGRDRLSRARHQIETAYSVLRLRSQLIRPTPMEPRTTAPGAGTRGSGSGIRYVMLNTADLSVTAQ
jgi:hypothetical protein